MTGPPALDVSRETHQRLTLYAELLRQWTARINLVARSTLPDLWTRHFADSAQLYRLAPHPVDHWADLGSGGGFPGLVIGILGMEAGSPARVTLVESDMRKAAFLATVIRQTGAPATVIARRAETLKPLGADVLSARALASLPVLLGHAERHLAPSGTALFPKGVSWEKECVAARDKWKFDARVATSETDDGAVVMSIKGVARV